MKVKMLSRKMIKPKNPTPNHLRTCKLSFFDQLQIPVHIPTINFYPSSGCTKTSMSENLQRLETSLSDTLSRFHPLAGRFSVDGLSVNCNDQGVEYIEAEVLNYVTLSELLINKAEENLELLCSLFQWDIESATLDITPILGIQVSTFECGGVAICTYWSHLLYDGFSGSTFFHEWSVACRAGIDGVMFSNFSMASIFPARDLSRLLKPFSPSFDKNIKIVRKRLLFSEKSITDLKSKVIAKSDNVMINPTHVDVVTCAIWKVLISIDQEKHGSFSRDSTVCTSVNLRGRTGLKAIQKNIFGNFVFQIPNRFKWAHIGNKMEDLELHQLLSLFKNTIKKELVGCSKIVAPDELVTYVAEKVNGICGDMEKEEVDLKFLSSMCKFPMYEVDFGWGKPEWITFVNVPKDAIILTDSKCGTKIEATVSLGEMDMHAFENHPDILAFTCQID